ncbi:MAG: hypothetical protein L6W00_15220 [Lentisphaeria bacterium]|nr:MAG: hypothetical protein L6W00_15220 [Lentisphaeria bacterium]
MGLFGFLRGGLCVLCGVECGSDAELENAPFDGLRHSRVIWKGKKGNGATPGRSVISSPKGLFRRQPNTAPGANRRVWS